MWQWQPINVCGLPEDEWQGGRTTTLTVPPASHSTASCLQFHQSSSPSRGYGSPSVRIRPDDIGSRTFPPVRAVHLNTSRCPESKQAHISTSSSAMTERPRQLDQRFQMGGGQFEAIID